MFQVARSPTTEEVKWKTLDVKGGSWESGQWERNERRAGVHWKDSGIICPCIYANKDVSYFTVFDREEGGYILSVEKEKGWWWREKRERNGEGKKGEIVAMKGKGKDSWFGSGEKPIFIVQVHFAQI